MYLLNNMACENPRLIQKKGHYKENNYRGQAGDYYELSTFADCGDCENCRAAKANNWVCRNYYEAKEAEKKCFITLTYRHAPYFLVRKDFTDFIKRFRYEINKEYYEKLRNVSKGLSGEQLQQWKEDHAEEFIKTRIFYAGEYGELNGRSHGHMIIYGWDDPNAKPIRINKKSNIIYKSEVIEKTWGYGFTSIQPFGDKEAPYIALYNTSQDSFKRAYKLTRKKVKQLERSIPQNANFDEAQKKNMLLTLNEAREEMEKNKKNYYAIREFNGWSMSLGWEGFLKQYLKSQNYAYVEYVLGAEYATPTPWLKKLANKYGDAKAAEEIFRREREAERPKSEKEAREKALQLKRAKRKEEILKRGEERNVVEDL